MVEGNLDFIVSRCSLESHKFLAAWGDFASTLEDALSTMALPLYGETNAMGSTLAGEDKDKFNRLTEAESSTKSSYESWICYFDEDEGSCSEDRMYMFLHGSTRSSFSKIQA